MAGQNAKDKLTLFTGRNYSN